MSHKTWILSALSRVHGDRQKQRRVDGGAHALRAADQEWPPQKELTLGSISTG